MNNVVTKISTPYSTGHIACPYGCGRSFKHATQKAIHVRKAHTGERPFTCKFDGCGKAFYSSGDVKSHEKTHLGVKPFQCESCGKYLSSRNALKVHIKALHTLERPFKCEVPDCGMTYMTRLDLDRHSKKHAKALERQEKQKVKNLEKRTERAEKQLQQLMAKNERNEKKLREGKHLAPSGTEGGRSKSDARANAEAAVTALLRASSAGRLVSLEPGAPPPPGAVAYFIPSEETIALSGGSTETLQLDDFVVNNKAHAALARDAAAARRSAAVGNGNGRRGKQPSGSGSRGGTDADVVSGSGGGGVAALGGAAGAGGVPSYSALTVTELLRDGGDPTVQGGGGAMAALALARGGGRDGGGGGDGDDDDAGAAGGGEAPSPSPSPSRFPGGGAPSSEGGAAVHAKASSDLAAAGPGGSGGDGGGLGGGGLGDPKAGSLKRSRGSSASLDGKGRGEGQGQGGATLSKRRALDRKMRSEYEAGGFKGKIPFQSWRRGLSTETAARFAREAEKEAAAARREGLDGGASRDDLTRTSS